MSPLFLVTLVLGNIQGALTTVAIYRYRKRRKEGSMPQDRAGETGTLAFVRRHAVAFVLISVLLDVVLTGMLALVYVQVKHIQECQGGYLSGSASRAAARDDALQTLLDDVGDHASEETFFHDLKVEQGAYKVLKAYRDAHAHAKGCQ